MNMPLTIQDVPAGHWCRSNGNPSTPEPDAAVVDRYEKSLPGPDRMYWEPEPEHVNE